MTVKQLFPVNQQIPESEIVRQLGNVYSDVSPFDSEVIDFLNSVSSQLSKQSRSNPALAPLAFFMRKSALKQLEQQAQLALPHHCIFVPQGNVLHIPPTNVDTLFLYTLSLSLLAGNTNLVRISHNSGPETFQVLDILFRELSHFPRVAQLVCVIQFGHEKEIMETLSRETDLRMIWGGNETIHAVRQSPLPVYASDLAFPDRISLSAISVSGWLTADTQTRHNVIAGLYNDVYWFDQMACSSPQSLVLVGGTTMDAEEVKAEIEGMLEQFAHDRYEIPEGQAINKMTAAVRAVSAGASHIQWKSNYSVMLDGLPLESLEDVRPGGGFLGINHFLELRDLTTWVNRKVQTLSVFGFSEDDLHSFATEVNGRGIDRIVPIGKALDFSDVWDGKNILLELMRLVRIEA